MERNRHKKQILEQNPEIEVESKSKQKITEKEKRHK